MGRRGQMSIVFACGVGHSNIPGSFIPGTPVTPLLRQEKETYIHLHAGYMSLNMILTTCLWTCYQYGTQSKSLCSVLHTPNLIPYLYPNLNHIHLWSMIQVNGICSIICRIMRGVGRPYLSPICESRGVSFFRC